MFLCMRLQARQNTFNYNKKLQMKDRKEREGERKKPRGVSVHPVSHFVTKIHSYHTE